MHRILIGIGSNLEPEQNVRDAIRALIRRFDAVRVSTCYYTRPLHNREQPPYINGVASALTSLAPQDVLEQLREIEHEAGRERPADDAFASRPLDLDLLLFDALVAPELNLPKPDLLERDFVLLPAAQVAGELRHPLLNATLAELAATRSPEPKTLLGEAPIEPPSGGAPPPVRLENPSATPGPAGTGTAAAAGGNPAAETTRSFAAVAFLWPPVRRVLFVLLAAYVGLAAVLYVFQARYIFFPLRSLEATPMDVGLEFEEVRLDVEGDSVHGWYCPAKGCERGTVLFCHGNAGNISHRLDTLRLLNSLGFATLIFDYRGYGASTGRPSEARMYADAAAAWRHLTEGRQVSPSRILLFGRSLGGAVAAQLATCQEPGALVIESSFTSVPDMASGIYPYLPVRLLARYRYSTAAYASEARCPVVVIHSRDDELIPFVHGQHIYAAAREPKVFIEISGSHNTGFLTSGTRYTQALDAALAAWFPPNTGTTVPSE